MQKKVLVNLIRAHYEDDPSLFFTTALDVLKEFKDNGDTELYNHIVDILKPKIKIRPKRQPPEYDPEINFEDAEELGFALTPQAEVDSETADRIALEQAVKTKTAWPKNDACPKSPHFAYLEGDEIVIVFHAFGHESQVFKTFRYKIADKDITWCLD